MAQSNSSQASTQQTTQSSQANTTPLTAPASTQPRKRGKFGRRALIATAGVGVCAAGVALTPLAIRDASQFASDQAHQALTSGIAQGEQAIINDLGQLEGVARDDAIAVAELTRKAVQFIVLPVSKVVAVIAGDGLAVLDTALTATQQGLNDVHIHISQISAMQQIVQSWHSNVNQLPIALTAFANADIISAENYLKALRAKVQASGGSTH